MSGPPIRKPDPNRFKHIDLMPEDARADVDFMRSVQDLEDQQQNRSGWLFARGAFDKGDLLYLRDEEEKRRHVELDLRDTERDQFMAMRARAEEEEQRKAAAAAARAAAARKAQQAQQDRKRLLVPMVRLKPAADSQGGSEWSGPAVKRPRADSGLGSEAAAALDSEAGSEQQGGAAAEGSLQTQGTGGALEGEEKEESGNKEGGLAGLLGGYGSDPDSGSQEDAADAEDSSAGAGATASQQQQQQQQGQQSQGGRGGAGARLPSAADLLGSL